MSNDGDKPADSRIAQLQRARNSDSRDAWGSFASHRDRVTELLQRCAKPGASSLCVLGAGNCNDLDLSVLCRLFHDVQLVDIDEAALTSGVERQKVNVSTVQVAGGVDVTGGAELLSRFTPNIAAAQDEVAECLARAQTVPAITKMKFDVVLSACLLSQLIDGIVHSVGEAHPQFLDLVVAVRLQHLRLLLDLTLPGGTAILMTDIVSSTTCPELTQTADADLPRVVSAAINARNFFTGVNPVVLRALFAQEPSLAPRVASIELTAPWLWNLGPRMYAVCAILVTRQ